MTYLDLNGMTDLPAGKVASIVTSLEMTAPPEPRDAPARDDLTLVRMDWPSGEPDLAWYRELYRRIGEDWLWFSRLELPDGPLAAILDDPGIEVYALMADGRAEGIVELDRRRAPDVELAFFGLTEGLVGKGAGRWMMTKALEIAWSTPPRRLWVHTCTLDHPAALSFYMRSGFRPFRRSIEVVDDPRLTGTLRRDAAAHIPVLLPGKGV